MYGLKRGALGKGSNWRKAQTKVTPRLLSHHLNNFFHFWSSKPPPHPPLGNPGSATGLGGHVLWIVTKTVQQTQPGPLFYVCFKMALVPGTPPLFPISFFFMQFRQKSCQITGWHPKLGGWRPPREILDPPLWYILISLKFSIHQDSLPQPDFLSSVSGSVCKINQPCAGASSNQSSVVWGTSQAWPV